MNWHYVINRVGQVYYHQDRMRKSDDCVIADYEACIPAFGRMVVMVRNGPLPGAERDDGTGCRAVTRSIVCVVTYDKIART